MDQTRYTKMGQTTVNWWGFRVWEIPTLSLLGNNFGEASSISVLPPGWRARRGGTGNPGPISFSSLNPALVFPDWQGEKPSVASATVHSGIILLSSTRMSGGLMFVVYGGPMDQT